MEEQKDTNFTRKRPLNLLRSLLKRLQKSCLKKKRQIVTVRCGEIYWVEFSPVKGGERGGIRPALVVQNNVGNRYSPTTVVVAVTRTIPPKPFPFLVVVEPAENGLPARSVINCAQMATIPQIGDESRLRASPGQTAVQPIGQLSSAKMREVKKAIQFNLGIK